MQSRAWCLAAIAACCLTEMVAPPAKAGWGAEVGRMVVNSLMRQAVNRVIYQSRSYSAPSYQQPYQDSSNYGYRSPSAASTNERVSSEHVSSHGSGTAHRHVTATARGALHYPSDKKFVPPPPPYPEVYPGEPDTSILSAGGKKHSSGMDLVPPPPPAPSVWDDLTPVSAEVSATPVIHGDEAATPALHAEKGRSVPVQTKKAMVPKHENIGGYTKHPAESGIIGSSRSTAVEASGADPVSDSDQTSDTVPKPAPDFHRHKVAVHHAT